MLLFSDVFVPELLAAKERVADDVRRGGVEGREGARGIEMVVQVVEEVEEFFAQAALGFKGIVIRGFGSFCGRCCRGFVFVFFSVFFVIFLDFFFEGFDSQASSSSVKSSYVFFFERRNRRRHVDWRTIFGLNFERSEEASLFGDADEHMISCELKYIYRRRWFFLIKLSRKLCHRVSPTRDVAFTCLLSHETKMVFLCFSFSSSFSSFYCHSVHPQNLNEYMHQRTVSAKLYV